MAGKYTISTAMKTGKKSPTYGTEYYIKFAESEDTFTLWFKTEPTQGQEVYGEINGSRFKKIRQEGTSSPAPVKKSTGRYDSDGQRQGMCINNAANYVNSMATELVDADTWAKTVYAYANALYLMGDLGTERVAESTKELFSGNK